ncbi:hypothetical protein OG426_10060 [Streptomyces canus]|uniref:hypothetical protein n=1 Tax=Streptomyces canus TaxID=58343 RepID=UPI00386E2742|nr:hypothetical protein OG426_10060 [Streptomyces canus]
MVDGFIDWASLTEVANSYHGTIRDTYRWSAMVSIEVTCGLVHGRQFKVLPSPARGPITTKGPHDVLRAAVTEYVDSTQPTQETIDKRVKDVDIWARRNATKVRDTLQRCMNDPDNVYGPSCGFDVWLATALGTNAEATALRVGGLFDLTFARALSKVLVLDERDLRRVWQESLSLRSIPQDGNLAEVVRSAYVLSILLRGRYHDLVAREMGMQVMHHPMRTAILPELPRTVTVPVTYPVSNSERFMAHLLWASGFAERRQNDRILLWADNVRRMRLAVLAEEIDLPQRISDDHALRTAVDAARRVGIRTHKRLIDDGVDLAVALGIGALSSFIVDGWPDMYITLATYAASKKQDVGDRLMRPTFENRRRLKNLAEMPGRINPNFIR